MIANMNKTLTFEQAVNAIYVAVKRGKEIIILKVKKILTSFRGGQKMRVIILSDGSHYREDENFLNRMWEVTRA